MKCPHCKKNIPWGLDTKAKLEAIKLRKKGASLRNIAEVLHRAGLAGENSHISLQRFFAKGKNK